MLNLKMNDYDSIISLEYDFACTAALATAISKIISTILENEYKNNKKHDVLIKKAKQEIAEYILEG